MSERELFEIHKALIQAFLREHDYDGVLLSRTNNFAMATGGKRNYIYEYSDFGANSVFFTKDGRAFFAGNNIEETRGMDEELGPLGCDSRNFLWCEDNIADVIRREFTGTLVSDDGSLGKDVNAELLPLRTLLTPAECEKYRRLGALSADAMTATLNAVKPGMLEADIAATLKAEGLKRRLQVPVALIAADGRIARYRHPLPTEALLLGDGLKETGVERYVMIVGCFLREGLVASLTRFVRVAGVSAEILDAYDRVCGVDALVQEATVPGATLSQVFGAVKKAYADMGFAANEWHNHHQGGPTGYGARTIIATPSEAFAVLDTKRYEQAVKDISGIEVKFGQAYAWNPSAPGVKSEDTFLLLPGGAKEIVTSTPALPQVDLGRVLGRSTPIVKYGMKE